MILTLIQLLVIKFCCALGADINHHRLDNGMYLFGKFQNIYTDFDKLKYKTSLVGQWKVTIWKVSN